MAGIDWANRTWQAQKYHYRPVSRWQAALLLLLLLLRHDADRDDSDYQALRHGTASSLLFSSPAFTLTRRLCSALYLLCVLVLVPAVAVLSLAAPSVVTTTNQAPQLVALSTLTSPPPSDVVGVWSSSPSSSSHQHHRCRCRRLSLLSLPFHVCEE